MFGLGKPKPEKFAKKVAAFLHKQGIDEPISYDEDEFALRVGQGDDARRFFLHNVYVEYCAAPWLQRNRVLAFYADAMQAPFDEIPEDFAEAKRYLLPRIQNCCYNGHIRLQLEIEGEDLDLAATDYVEGLSINLVFDLPQAVASVPASRLAEWGIEFDEALAVARENLLDISKDPFEKIAPGVYVATWEDTHNATRMLLHEILWHLHVNGNYVVMVPTRNHLLVTGSEDSEGLLTIAALTEVALNEEPRTITGNAYELKSTSWTHFLPHEEHVAYPLMKLLSDQTLAEDYNQQKEMLERLLDKQEQDIFVASVMCLKREEDALTMTLSVWSEGIVTLLPKTDLIAFNSEGAEEHFICRWGDVVAVCDLVETGDYTPERYRVEQFPTAEQLAELENKAVSFS